MTANGMARPCSAANLLDWLGGVKQAPSSSSALRPTIPLEAPERTCSRNARTTGFDPGCVKTPKTRKPLEWSFSDRSKSHALANFHDHNRDPKECLFYRVFASPRFYTTKTRCRHPAIRDTPSMNLSGR